MKFNISERSDNGTIQIRVDGAVPIDVQHMVYNECQEILHLNKKIHERTALILNQLNHACPGKKTLFFSGISGSDIRICQVDASNS